MEVFPPPTCRGQVVVALPHPAADQGSAVYPAAVVDRAAAPSHQVAAPATASVWVVPAYAVAVSSIVATSASPVPAVALLKLQLVSLFLLLRLLVLA